MCDSDLEKEQVKKNTIWSIVKEPLPFFVSGLFFVFSFSDRFLRHWLCMFLQEFLVDSNPATTELSIIERKLHDGSGTKSAGTRYVCATYFNVPGWESTWYRTLYLVTPGKVICQVTGTRIFTLLIIFSYYDYET